jgi:murein DD-endopeptidase MepM/ murein hydrolase activator NlpD
MADRLALLLAALPLLLSPGAPAPPLPVGGAAATPSAQGVWPLQPAPTVVAGFDPPDSAYGAGHRGVDLAGRAGEPVHAALAGRVTFAGTLAGRGVVVVDHGSVRTTYEPVSPSVTVGQSVARGAVIGRLTTVQSHCFPAACLHWGLIRNSDDVYLDPLTLVGLAPVRLLPLWRDLPWVG